MRIVPRLTVEELETHDFGYSVFDIGQHSIIVQDRTVDYVFVTLILAAILLTVYLVLSLIAALFTGLFENVISITTVASYIPPTQ